MKLSSPVQRTKSRGMRLAGALLIVAVWFLLPSMVLAHEGEDGVDAGFAHVVATTDAAGVAMVELHVTETDDCGKFSAIGISAERDPATVSGDLQQLGACAFGGSLALTEQGRWMVTVSVAYEGHPTTIAVPVGFSGEPQTFERADWLHVESSIATDAEDGAWYRPSSTLVYAAIGLLVGTAIELARRRLKARTAD